MRFMLCASATCLCTDNKPTFSFLDDERPCEREKMFRKKNRILPKEIKMEETERSVEMQKFLKERQTKFSAPQRTLSSR